MALFFKPVNSWNGFCTGFFLLWLKNAKKKKTKCMLICVFVIMIGLALATSSQHFSVITKENSV